SRRPRERAGRRRAPRGPSGARCASPARSREARVPPRPRSGAASRGRRARRRASARARGATAPLRLPPLPRRRSRRARGARGLPGGRACGRPLGGRGSPWTHPERDLGRELGAAAGGGTDGERAVERDEALADAEEAEAVARPAIGLETDAVVAHEDRENAVGGPEPDRDAPRV